MFSSNNKISVRQLNRLLVLDLFGVSCLIIPYMAVQKAGRDGLISVILGTIMALLYAYLMIWFGRKVETDYFIFAKKTVGSFLTFLFCILYCVKFFFSCVFAVGLFGQILNETLLTDTSYQLIVFVIVAVAAFMASKGIEVRGRIAEVLYFIIIIPILLAFCVGVTKVDMANILPLFTEKGTDIISGGYMVLMAYAAIEMLILGIPLVNKDKKIFKQVSKSIIVVGVIQILMFIVTVGMLGVYGAKDKVWSVVTVMQVIELPSGFVQRLDGLILAFFILSSFMIVSAFLYYLSLITSRILHAKDDKFYRIPIAIFVFLVAASLIDMQEIYSYYIKYMMYIGLPQSIAIPAFIVCIAFLKRKGRKDVPQ